MQQRTSAACSASRRGGIGQANGRAISLFIPLLASVFVSEGGDALRRLLAHRSYSTSRLLQFFFALLGCFSMQKGPLWWCSHHRHHHRTADTEKDAHSPVVHGFWWSHIGWFLCSDACANPEWKLVPDLAAFPELIWLDSLHALPPLTLACGLYAVGGLRAVVYGFVVSTVLLWHCTYLVNSIAHLQVRFLLPC